MKRTKRTQTTLETETVWIIRRPASVQLGWCGQCGKTVQKIPPEEAAVLASVSSRTIFRWVESGKLHYTETPDGLLWICRNSIG